MGKRSEFPRIPQDAYDTPAAAVAPLLPHLPPRTRFVEPCRGAGALIRHLEDAGHVCVSAYDLPDHDARVKRYDIPANAMFITNPPWRRAVLHPIITNLPSQAATWLLIDADWAHTRQAIPYLPRLRKIVSVGRVKWISDSQFTGEDNCCWYLFERPRPDGHAAIHFIGRADDSTTAITARRAA